MSDSKDGYVFYYRNGALHRFRPENISKSEAKELRKKQINDLRIALDEKYGRKLESIGNVTMEDVTEEYKSKAHPGIQKFRIQSSATLEIYDPKEKKTIPAPEIHIAKWALSEFGGKVILQKSIREKKGIPETSKKKMSDFSWIFGAESESKYWDLKSPDSPLKGNNTYRSGFKQIAVPYGPSAGHPGGLIVDVKDKTIPLEKVRNHLAELFKNSRINEIDTIIRHSDTDYKVFRLKKKGIGR